MSVAVSELLRFILQLLGDPAKAEEFSADPTGALAVAGLDGVTCAEVDAITPLVANAVPGVVSIAHHGPIAFNGGPSAPEPAEMIRQLVSNVEVNSFANSGVISNIWGADEVTQAFAADGGMVFGGDLGGEDPIVIGNGNIVASDTAQASGRDTIQNQADGNLALGGDQTIAQDDGAIVGGNNNVAENTGNDNSVSVGGNQHNAENTGNDNSQSVGGNQYNAENSGNTQNQDDSVSVGGNQYNAENSGNTQNEDNSVNVGDIDLSDNSDHSDHSDNSDHSDHSDHSDNSTNIGGDYWEDGSNVGGIGNTDNRNSGNTTDSGNTVAITESHDDSINVGTVAIDLSSNDDNSVTTGDIINDQSLTVGDVDLSNHDDNSLSVGDVDLSSNDDNSVTSGDANTSYTDDHSVTTGDTVDYDYTYDDHSVGGDYFEEGGGSSYDGDYYETGSGNTTVMDESTATSNTSTVVDTDFDYSWGA